MAKKYEVIITKKAKEKMLVDSFTILYRIEDSAVYIENIYHNKSDIEKRVQQMFRRVLWGGQFRGSHAPIG